MDMHSPLAVGISICAFLHKTIICAYYGNIRIYFVVQLSVSLLLWLCMLCSYYPCSIVIGQIFVIHCLFVFCFYLFCCLMRLF
jgi:hypothetical protein